MKPLFALAFAAVMLTLPARAAEPRFDTPEARAQYHVMVGELAYLRGESHLAAEEFVKALDQVADAELAMRAASLALSAGDEKLARTAARRWQQLDPKNSDAREALTRLALRAGDRADAFAQCDAIVTSHVGTGDGFRSVALLLSQEPGHREDSLAVMEQLRLKYVDSPQALHAQSLLALRFGQTDLAEKSARAALKLKPDSIETRLLLAGVLVRRNDIPGSEQVMADLLKGSKEPQELRMAYARLLLDAEHVPEARKQFEAILKILPKSPEANYALALVALQQEDYKAAEKSLKLLLEDDTLKQPAMFYLGRAAEAQKKLPEALDWYKQVTRGDLAMDAAARRAAVLARSGKLAEARALLTDLRQSYPALAARFYLTEGEILLEVNALPEALSLYREALDEYGDDDDLLYGMSLVHDRMKNPDEAEADLRTILRRNADDARALNALGYILTQREGRLEEARKLVTRAFELTPDDAAVIDSMGWIEFHLGNLQNARVLLERAFAKVKDPEIAAHLGEVLWKLGQKDEARNVWNGALTRDPDHRVLRETVDRLSK